MAASILSQDLLGICLLLASGDTSTSLEDVIRAAERFQETNNRHFGITRSDLRNLFRGLVYHKSRRKTIREIELWEIIPDVLGFVDAYFNDEGEHWIGSGRDVTSEDYEGLKIEYRNGYSEQEFCRRLEIKQTMKEFFSQQTRPQPELVREFLATQGLDESLLRICSRHGGSS